MPPPPPTRTSPRASITSRTARLKKSPPLSRWSGVSAQPLTAPWPILPRPLKAGLRFVCGTTEADFTAEKSAGKRMPSGVMELIVVSAAKAEEKPAEEKPTEESPVEETKTGFTDVLDADWFKADVESSREQSFMTGTSRHDLQPQGRDHPRYGQLQRSTVLRAAPK